MKILPGERHWHHLSNHDNNLAIFLALSLVVIVHFTRSFRSIYFNSVSSEMCEKPIPLGICNSMKAWTESLSETRQSESRVFDRNREKFHNTCPGGQSCNFTWKFSFFTFHFSLFIFHLSRFHVKFFTLSDYVHS